MATTGGDYDENETFLESVVRLCGSEVASRLVDAYGGEAIWIPNQYLGVCAFCQVLTPEEAAPLMKHWGGETVILPMWDKARRSRIHARVVEMLKSGATVNQVVRACGVARATVFRIKRKPK